MSTGLHESQNINGVTSRLAVPGGWIYTQHLVVDEHEGYITKQIATTFVPDPQAEHVRAADVARQAQDQISAIDALKQIMPFVDTGGELEAEDALSNPPRMMRVLVRHAVEHGYAANMDAARKLVASWDAESSIPGVVPMTGAETATKPE